MNSFTERQLQIEPSKFSYKMWKDMPVTMYQSFTFFNLTNWNQVKSMGQKPRFVEVGPYVYKTIWTKADINFMDEQKLISFSEKKLWIFDPKLSKGYEEDLIWTINTPLMTALALIQNAPVITRNVVSVILDGLGEGAFIRRNIKSLLFDGYADLIVSVGPLFDRRFANFNGKFAYLYNKNDSIDGTWTVSTGSDDIANLNKIIRFQSNIVNMTSFSSGQLPQGLNEVKPECASAWSLDQSTNGQLFAPFSSDLEQLKLHQQLQAIRARQVRSQPEVAHPVPVAQTLSSSPVIAQAKRFFSRSVAAPTTPTTTVSSSLTTPTTTTTATIPNTSSMSGQINLPASDQQGDLQNPPNHQQDLQELVPNPFLNQKSIDALTSNQQSNHHNMNNQVTTSNSASQNQNHQHQQDSKPQLKDIGKFIFYPDLCRPLHLLPAKQEVTAANGIKASRYYIDPRIFMNSTQLPSNRCFEMNPRPPLANALAATINSVTGANVALPNLVSGASSPFAMFSPPSGLGGLGGHLTSHHHHPHHHDSGGGTGGPFGGVSGLFERSNHPTSFLNNALHSLSATVGATANNLSGIGGNGNGAATGGSGANSASSDQQASASNQAPISRLGRVRQLFSNIVSQRMSAAGPGSLLPSLAGGPAGMLIGAGHNNHNHAHHNNNHHHHPFSSLARNSPDASESVPSPVGVGLFSHNPLVRRGGPLASALLNTDFRRAHHPNDQVNHPNGLANSGTAPAGSVSNQHNNHLLGQPTGSDRWVTQFRFKWPRGVFSIGQCQLGAPIYASLPHFLDADDYYLEQVDGLKPNRSLHEFYIDIESTLHSIPVGAKARLQLNVATPELRFRNIPNAMIPVLWQEVTFNIDKPVAAMLYWSFTMSSTIYQLISILMLIFGTSLMVYSLAGGLIGLRRVGGKSSASSSSSSLATLSNSTGRGSTNGPKSNKNHSNNKVINSETESHSSALSSSHQQLASITSTSSISSNQSIASGGSSAIGDQLPHKVINNSHQLRHNHRHQPLEGHRHWRRPDSWQSQANSSSEVSTPTREMDFQHHN